MGLKDKDKRRFLRYPRKRDCNLKHGDKTYNAEAVDYSLNGLGVKVPKDTPIKLGDVLSIEACYPGNQASGKVVWLRDHNGTTQLGIRRIGMLSGSLSDFSFADVLLGINRSGYTGVLIVASKPMRKSIYFDSGEMIFARSDEPSYSLGHYMLAEGTISREQFDKMLSVTQVTGKRQGKVLVELGYIEPRALFETVTGYVESIIEGLFSLTSGDFLFKEGPLPSSEVIKLGLSVANIIYRGIKAIDDYDYIKSRCPYPDEIITFSADPLNLFQDLNVTDEDKELLKAIDERKSFRELIESSGRAEFEAIKSVYALLSTRVIEVLQTVDEAEDITADSVIGEKPGEDVEETIKRIIALYDQHESLGFYGVLGVGPDADYKAIKKAFYKKAKEFHPDRHFSLPEDMKGKLNAVFSYITTAYSTLISPELRASYDNRPLVRKTQDESEGSNEQIATQRFKDGMHEFERANYSQAAQLFGAAAYLNSTEPKYHFFCGIALSKEGKLKDAERAVSRALKTDPFNALYLAESGHIYLDLGFPLRARGNFQKALNVQPNNKRALQGLAKLPPEIE